MPLAIRDAAGALMVSDPNVERTLELQTGTHIEGGNRVEHLQNGDGTYPLARSAIGNAVAVPTKKPHNANRCRAIPSYGRGDWI